MEISGIKPIGSSGSEPVELPVQRSPDVAAPNEELGQSTGAVEDPQKERENVAEAIEKLNQTAMIFDRGLRFHIHDKTKTTMVSVVDLKSDKIIREIPSKEILDLVSKMKDYLGMIFDKKA
jgi:flagellar protein FlaG